MAAFLLGRARPSTAHPLREVSTGIGGLALALLNFATLSVAGHTWGITYGFALVILFMLIFYKGAGLVADLALTFNLVMIVAILSMLQATLTLPGIAGIVLTVGMAVDANVLIFERIREELRNGNSPQASIQAGYEKAFSTIADANITTLIAALVLLQWGTGPIKGFAVTLAVGIVTSMFTAIVGTRTIVDVLNSQNNLRRAETTYARSRYDYILNVLRLKQAAGTLQVQDLENLEPFLVARKPPEDQFAEEASKEAEATE